MFQFKWPDKHVYSLVGCFTALAYLSPLLGGWIADHLLGQKRTILIGALILFVSYCALSFIISEQVLVLSLAGIAVGTGLLKPNISSLLGNEYAPGSPHRERGFMFFYMGLTIGIVLGTVLPSFIHEHLGWSAAFLSAAVGMMIATGVFVFGIHRYNLLDYQPFEFKVQNQLMAISLCVLAWIVACYVMHYPFFADVLFCVVVLFSLSYFFYCVKHESVVQARQTVVLGLLCLISVVFWAFYFQMFLSLTLFILRVAEPSLWGFAFPAPYYVGVQSVGMIALGLFLVRRKTNLNIIQQAISTGNKFLTAICFTTLAYGLIVLDCYVSLWTGMLSPLFILPAYLIFSLAEMLLSPVGLSAVTLLACRKKVSTLMGVFFASLGIGAFLAGKLAELTAVPSGNLSLYELKQHYALSFSHLFYTLVIAMLLCVGLNFVIGRLMRSIIMER